jgi:DNA-directed RNA polymerase subunit K/omega
MSDIEDSDNEGSTKYESDKEESEPIIFNKQPLPIDSDQDDSDNDLGDDDELEQPNTSENITSIKESTTSNDYNFNDEYNNISPINSDIDSDDEDYLQKFDNENKKSYIQEIHPECIIDNLHTVEMYSIIKRNDKGVIDDEYHKSIPFLTKYEKTRILGQRAQQINSGSEPFVDVPENIIDGYLVAEIELAQKKIPFIIRRPMPNNTFEYWKVNDLELI